MDILNLLSNISNISVNPMVTNLDSISLNWIGDIIKWLIEGVGITGLGIIVFTLILKTIVLPLDIYSRRNTKKQALVMDKMRPQMEKLQKQYANDEKMYNQKVMELYKANGYSMFGACIPMIVSLVIFMIVFSAFSTYSQYATLEQYRNMVDVYNSHIICYVENGDENTADDFLIVAYDENGDENGYYIDFDAFETYYNALVEEDDSYVVKYSDGVEYYTWQSFVSSLTGSTTDIESQKNNFVVNYFTAKPAQQAVAEYYKDNNAGFLWVGNIWYPDSMLNKEIADYDKFASTVNKITLPNSYESSYYQVLGGLEKEQSSYNGYFILIVLSIGAMLLQQWITSRSQKSVNELGTVNGSGASTNKMMMVMMPIMYGIFSFFYSAAFSIYMITNTIYSIITTLIINKAMDVSFAKKEAKEELAKYERKTISSSATNRKKLK